MTEGIAAVIERMRDAYDQIAPLYPGTNTPMPDDLQAIAVRLLQLSGTAPALLDVGCGPGRHMAWFESQGARSTGIDLSHAMLLHARRLVRGPVLQMDMRTLGFHDGVFTTIWCCASLLHLPRSEAPRALRELRRVLVRGGICFLAVQEGTGEGWERRQRYGSVERLFTRYGLEEMATLMRQSGFEPQEQCRTNNGSPVWLQFLAVAD
jgi:SAM-dependent methyltransferase